MTREVEIVRVELGRDFSTHSTEAPTYTYTVIGYDVDGRKHTLNWYRSNIKARDGMGHYKRYLPLTVNLPVKLPFMDLLP